MRPSTVKTRTVKRRRKASTCMAKTTATAITLDIRAAVLSALINSHVPMISSKRSTEMFSHASLVRLARPDKSDARRNGIATRHRLPSAFLFVVTPGLTAAPVQKSKPRPSSGKYLINKTDSRQEDVGTSAEECGEGFRRLRICEYHEYHDEMTSDLVPPFECHKRKVGPGHTCERIGEENCNGDVLNGESAPVNRASQKDNDAHDHQQQKHVSIKRAAVDVRVRIV